MNRNIRTKAIALKAERFGEFHKNILFLTSDSGLLRAVAHGAYKGRSKLGGSTDPFCASVLFLYHNPIKNSYKVNDLELKYEFRNIRQNLRKYYIASLWSEVIIRTHAGGDVEGDQIFTLFLRALISLDQSPDEADDRVLIQFLWRYLLNEGFIADFNECSSCACSIRSDAFLSLDSLTFLCGNCKNSDYLLLSHSSRQYLEHTMKLNFNNSLKISCESKDMTNLKILIISLIEQLIEGKLRSLKGSFIL